VFLENEMMYGQSFELSDAVMDKDFVLPIGKAKVSARELMFQSSHFQKWLARVWKQQTYLKKKAYHAK